MKGIATVGGPENGSAARKDPANVCQGEFACALGIDKAIVSVRDANDFPSVFEDCRFDDGSDDSVKAGSVPASGGDTNTFDVGHDRYRSYRGAKDCRLHEGWKHYYGTVIGA